MIIKGEETDLNRKRLSFTVQVDSVCRGAGGLGF